MTALYTPPLSEWPDDAELRYRYWERVGIKCDSGTPTERAEAEALTETWAEYVANPHLFNR